MNPVLPYSPIFPIYDNKLLSALSLRFMYFWWPILQTIWTPIAFAFVMDLVWSAFEYMQQTLKADSIFRTRIFFSNF